MYPCGVCSRRAFSSSVQGTSCHARFHKKSSCIADKLKHVDDYQCTMFMGGNHVRSDVLQQISLGAQVFGSGWVVSYCDEGHVCRHINNGEVKWWSEQGIWCNVGVHQGSVLSLLLFIIVSEALSRRFRWGLSMELLYAGDPILLEDPEDL